MLFPQSNIIFKLELTCTDAFDRDNKQSKIVVQLNRDNMEIFLCKTDISLARGPGECLNCLNVETYHSDSVCTSLARLLLV
jgi:hypothetical protein